MDLSTSNEVVLFLAISAISRVYGGGGVSFSNFQKNVHRLKYRVIWVVVGRNLRHELLRGKLSRRQETMKHAEQTPNEFDEHTTCLY